MSLLKYLEDEKLRKEAWVRSAHASPSIGTAPYDFAQNGWPKETLVALFEEGMKHGRGSEHWKAAIGSDQKMLLSAELQGASSFIHILLDPETGKTVFKSSDMLFEAANREQAAQMISKASHQSGAFLRAGTPTSAYGGLWQGQAPEFLKTMNPGISTFHPLRGEDSADAWDRNFDSIDNYCEKQSDPVKTMEKIREQYLGASEKTMVEQINQEVKAGANTTISEQPARIVAIGGKGQEIRLAIPLKNNGQVDTSAPIIAMVGSTDKNAEFRLNNPKDEPMRFYNLEAAAKFAASVQTVDLSEFPAPHMEFQRANLIKQRELKAVTRAVYDPKPASPGGV